MRKVIIFILFLLAFSCKKDDTSPCFVSSGDIIIEERNLNYFNAIEVNDIFNVILVQDSVYKVVIEGYEGLLPYVSTTISEDSVLKLDHDITCKWARDYERISVYISFDSINDIIITKACNLRTLLPLKGYEIRYWPQADMNITNIEINCERFFLKSSYTSTGLVNISGTCYHLGLWAFGSLSIDASETNSTLTYVDHNSIGDFYVKPIYHLGAQIRHLGNLYYNDDFVQSFNLETFSTGKAISY